MIASQSQNTCVLEPLIAQESLLFCEGYLDEPITLPVLLDLSKFALVAVTHDTVLVPNPLLPRFRYEFTPLFQNDGDHFVPVMFSPEDRYLAFERLLSERPKLGFVETTLELWDIEYPSQQDRLRAAFRRDLTAELDGVRLTNVGTGQTRGIDDFLRGVLEDYRGGVFDYYCKLGALAEARGATLALPDNKQSAFFRAQSSLAQSTASALLALYNSKLEGAAAGVTITPYRRCTISAPMVLYLAVRDTAAGNRGGLLNTIADMHWFLAHKFRGLAAVLADADKPALLSFQTEIDSLLSKVLAGSQIPRPYTKLMIDVVTFIPTLLSGPEALLAKFKDICEAVSSPSHRELYSGLRIFNHLHGEAWVGMDEFYDELRRVFGDVAFSLDELSAAYSKNPLGLAEA